MVFFQKTCVFAVNKFKFLGQIYDLLPVEIGNKMVICYYVLMRNNVIGIRMGNTGSEAKSVDLLARSDHRETE